MFCGVGRKKNKWWGLDVLSPSPPKSFLLQMERKLFLLFFFFHFCVFLGTLPLPFFLILFFSFPRCCLLFSFLFLFISWAVGVIVFFLFFIFLTRHDFYFLINWVIVFFFLSLFCFN